jgi:hypothetical protein
MNIMKSLATIAIFLMCANNSWAQQDKAETTPQTARQALMEMFFSKAEGTFAKHLPAATIAALEKAGVLTTIQQYSAMLHAMQTQGKSVETFDTGSVLLTTEDPKTGEKSDITVENDSLQGDQDDIELTFHGYKNGQEQRTPFMPHLTFSMKMESGVWKLNEISMTMHLPLADPDLLKAFTENMKSHQQLGSSGGSFHNDGGSHVDFAPHAETSVSFQPANDAQVIAAMRNIVNAENVYSGTYHAVGYTCTLSDLDGFGGGAPNEHQAMLINSGLAGGHKYGYVFTLSGCGVPPAKSFTLTAAPGGNLYGSHPAYCTDQNGAIKYSADGNAARCQNNGMPVQ